MGGITLYGQDSQQPKKEEAVNEAVDEKPKAYKLSLGEKTRENLLVLLQRQAEIQSEINRILNILVEAREIPLTEFNWQPLDGELKEIIVVERKNQTNGN